MRYLTWFVGLAVAALLAGSVLLVPMASAADKEDEGFVALFNGKDLKGFKTILADANADPGKTWTVQDDFLLCTGNPNGYFYTDKSYKNYVLRYDWRYKRPADLTDESKFLGNSGCLVHIQEPHKVWPKCVEVQGMNRDHGKLLFLQCKKIDENFDRAAKDKATKPVGEWNTTEITCAADGSISAKINGTPVSSGKCDLTEGQIGWQSEGAEIHFRNIKIKEIK
jgi:hypothetical protein